MPFSSCHFPSNASVFILYMLWDDGKQHEDNFLAQLSIFATPSGVASPTVWGCQKSFGEAKCLILGE